MKLNKFLLIGAIALGMVACKKEDVPNSGKEKGDTYVGVTIVFPEAKTTRTGLPKDYNENGEWEGRDEIKTITVFMVNATAKTVDYTTFQKGAFQEIKNGILNPNLAVKATAGNKVKAYAVINGKQEILDRLKNTNSNNFETEFAKEAEALADQVAKYENKKEVVMMTNEKYPEELTIAKGVSKENALKGIGNQVKVSVERVISRGMVTLKSDYAKEIKVKNAQGQEVSAVTISEVKYAVGQSNKQFFLMKQFNGKGTTIWKTPNPVYSYVPIGDWTEKAAEYFDYTGLETFTKIEEIENKDNTKVIEALKKEETSKFVLPVTHETYKKGNTTYFEIQATFTPTEKSFAEGEKEKLNGKKDYFLGMNDGKFYASREAAEKNGQKATGFRGGIMKYILWLNPNESYGGDKKITKSPTVRNQIYHAHITAFKEIGLPNNPLNPKDPKDPESPIDPDDPLQTEDIYMSVSITVLKWGIHSYEVNLGNDY